MSGTMIEPWILSILLTFSVIVVLIANWLTGGLRKPRLPSAISLNDIAGLISNLLWIAIIFTAGVIAARYIERIRNTALGYLVFGLVAFLLSWVRAILYQRARQQKEMWSVHDRKTWFDFFVHNVIYLLFAGVVYLFLALILRRSADPVLFIAVCFGALLPDLDSRDSVLGRLLPFLSHRVQTRFGYLGGWHSLATNAVIAVLSVPLIPIAGVQAWYLLSLGFCSHILLDLLSPQGVMLFWPVTHTRYNIFRGFVDSIGSPAEHRLAAGLAVFFVLLATMVDIDRPSPIAAPAPSYEETLQRYYLMRGSNLMYAFVEGSWQATGLRMSGWLEILNAANESFVMVDRYDGKIFTAGRSAGDDLYLNRITLRTGPSVRIKPVEIHLQDQTLREGFPVLYEMQREPGLEHIYVSGDVVVSLLQSDTSPALQVDYSQTKLRRIQWSDEGHYTLQYLTAGELIELADLRVETADLVIVATYASPAAGPTVTPLPSPPAMAKPEP